MSCILHGHLVLQLSIITPFLVTYITYIIPLLITIITIVITITTCRQDCITEDRIQREVIVVIRDPQLVIMGTIISKYLCSKTIFVNAKQLCYEDTFE